jgi:hypothetical protein
VEKPCSREACFNTPEGVTVKVIISNIIGGLGNQMFQYAAGKAASMQKGVAYKLDISSFETYDLHRGFELGKVFNCSIAVSDRQDIKNILGWQGHGKVRQALTRPKMRFLGKRELVIEPHFHYWPSFNEIPDNACLYGYWQSEKYFQHIAEELRHDFTFKEPLNEENAEIEKKIRTVNSVSLHIRRGDYVNDSKTAKVLSLCSLEYYFSAVKSLSEKVNSPHFFIFSDDIEWAKSHLKINFPCDYISNNEGDKSYIDMRLMSLCQHNIIANSSFSWWGAWLNNNKDKIVIAPGKWFLNKNNTKDLYPTDWLIR